MSKRFFATFLSATIILTSLSTAPARAADRGEMTRLLLGAGTILFLGHALSNSNRNHNSGTVTRRRGDGNHHNPRHIQPRHKVVPSACLRVNRFDRGPKRYFGNRCLNNNMRNAWRLPDHCLRTVRTNRGKRTVFGARCLRQNGWVFG